MARKGGNPDIKKITEPYRFSKDNQPSPAAKRKGHERNRIKRKAMQEILDQVLTGDEMEIIRASLAKMFGVNAKEIDIKTIAHLIQLKKAIKDGDTKAYNSVMDRVFGKPTANINVNPYDKRLGIDYVGGDEEE